MKKFERLILDLTEQRKKVACELQNQAKLEHQLSLKIGDVQFSVGINERLQQVELEISVNGYNSARASITGEADMRTIKRWLDSLLGDSTTEYMKDSKDSPSENKSKPIWAKAIFRGKDEK